MICPVLSCRDDRRPVLENLRTVLEVEFPSRASGESKEVSSSFWDVITKQLNKKTVS